MTVVEGLSGLGDSLGSASQQLAQDLDAAAIVVLGYHSGLDIGEALEARLLLGGRLVGVVSNGVTR